MIGDEPIQTAGGVWFEKVSIDDEQRSESIWEKVRQEVTCAICLELFDDPKSMPCLHTYCRKCLIQALVKTSGNIYWRDRPAINCPLCRAEVTLSNRGIEALPSNFSAARLVEAVQLRAKLSQNAAPKCDACKESDAAASCSDCGGGFFLCASCIKVHRSLPSTKNHTLRTLKDISMPRTSVASIKSFPLCQKHPEELLKLYCRDCEVLVCRDCVLVTHKTHDYSFVDDVIDDEKQQLRDITLRELDNILIDTGEAIDSVEQMQAKVLSYSDHHAAQLTKTFQDLVDMINKHKGILSHKITQIFEDTLSPLQQQHSDLIVLKKNTEKCRDVTNNVLKTGTNSEIMSAKKQMLERTKHLSKLYDSHLCPIAKPTKTVFYQLSKINIEIEKVAVFVDLQKCCIQNVPEEIHKKEKITLRVVLKDIKSQPICNAPDIIIVKIKTASNNNITSSVKEIRNGKYSVSFIPVEVLEHVVTIQINGMDISDSPLRIPCANESESSEEDGCKDCYADQHTYIMKW